MSIDLVGPDGLEYTLDNSDPGALDEALRQGFKVPVAPREKSALEEVADTAMAGTVGLVEGVTGGAMSGLLGLAAQPDSSGFVDPARVGAKKELKRLREEHPIASVVGEIGGAVASPINKAGEGVRAALKATSALGRVGANVAGGATTGLLFGAGKTLSDAALGDVDLTAERLIAGGGLGMVLGGLGGGLGGVVEEGARAVLPKAATLAKRAQSALDDIANDATISATRAQQGVINRIGDDKLRAAAEAIRARGLIRGSPDDMAKAIEAERSTLGKMLGGFLDKADEGGSKVDHMRMLNRLDDFEAKLNPLERDAIASDLRAARKAVAELGEQGSGFRQLDDLKQTIQAKAKFSRGPTPLDDTTLGLKRSLAGVFRDELDQQLLPVLGSDAGKAFTDTKALYGSLRDAERLAQSGAGRVGERGALGYVGLKDLLAGDILSGAGAPFGIAGAIGMKVLREQGPAMVARIADRLAKEPALQAMAKSFAAALPENAPKLGPYGAVLAQEAAVSPERGLAAHIAYAQLDPSYAATAQLAGLMPEEPAEQPMVMARAQTLAEASAAAAAQDEAVKKGIDRAARGGASPGSGSAFKSQDFGAMRMRRGAGAGYDKRVEEVRALATDPSLLVERVAANVAGLGQNAPNVTAALTNAASRAVQYLAAQAAVPPKAGPMAPEWDAPEADRQAFAEKLEVVQEPMSVLDSAASGTLTEGQMEALRVVYPRLAQQIADNALERMVAGGEVPYPQRLMLGMLAGVDPDGSMSPEAVAANQAAIAAAKQDVTPVAPVGQDASNVTLAQRTATPAQRREVRNEQ